MHNFALQALITSKSVINFLSYVCLCLAVTACVQNPAASSNSTVNHVVLLWFKPQVTQSKMDEIIHLTKQLNSIKGMEQLQIGRSLPSSRKIVDDSFDIGIYMRFNSVNDMNTYLKHPRHIELVDKHIKPNINKIIVYDFQLKN